MRVELGEAPPLPPWLEREMPFHRRMATVGGRRVHLVDQGPGNGGGQDPGRAQARPTRPVLMVHGNPTWSFLWRKVIRDLASREAETPVRVVAPDLVGFGLSDKPREVGFHRLDRHVETIAALVEALDLEDLTVVGQDWGGPVACGVAARLPGRIRGVVLGNTATLAPRRPLRPKAFHRFSHVPVLSDLVFRVGGFPLGALHLVQGERSSIGKVERRAYRWPFRRLADRAGPMALARMVPDREDHPTLAVLDEVDAWLRAFDGPAALVWGTRDPILGRALERLHEALPQAPVTETLAGHFLQEEVPHELAEAILHVTHGAGGA